MRNHIAVLSLCCIVAAAAPSVLPAQVMRPTTADSIVYARAKQLVENGNGAAGRVLVDSMVTVAIPDTPAYAEALYWRARLAASGNDAERDYRRIVVEYPLSQRAGDALLQLAQLEVARGDRASAAIHLERFLLENPQHADRARTGLLLVRISFEQSDFVRGCIALGRTLADVPQNAVELRNQLTYYSPRCASVDTTRVVAAASADSTAAKADSAKSTPAAAPKPKGKYTLQVAAYSSRAQAEALVKRLEARKIDARVDGTSTPFRVRIGYYMTRASATAALNKLKAQQIKAEIREIEVPK